MDNGIERVEGGAGYNVIQGHYDATRIDLSAVELLNIAEIRGGPNHNTVIGTAGNDLIYGEGGNDFLEGGAGDDTFIVEGAGCGSDTFSGGEGFDTILGGDGDDVFRLKSWSMDNGIERIEGGAGYNVIQGASSATQIDLSNVELLNISEIRGGANHNQIIGTAGDDLIYGEGGNDTLIGGLGNDTYSFSLSDDKETIRNEDTADDSCDTLEFNNISHEVLWFSQADNNLVIDVVGSNDQVVVEDWYLNEASRIDLITAEGSSLQEDQVAQLVNAMASFDVPTGSGAVIPQDVKNQLTPILSATWQ